MHFSESFDHSISVNIHMITFVPKLFQIKKVSNANLTNDISRLNNNDKLNTSEYSTV